MVQSFYRAALGLVSASLQHTPRTHAGKFVALVYAAFLFIICASFTANMAAFYFDVAVRTNVNSLEDAVQENYKICIAEMWNDAMERYGVADALVSKSGQQDMVDALNSCTAGEDCECTAGIYSLERLAIQQNNNKLCGFSVVGRPLITYPVGNARRWFLALPVAIPVSPYIRDALSWAVSRGIHDGHLFQVFERYRLAPSKCPKVVTRQQGAHQEV
eukprot:gene1636-2522_t